MPAAANVPAAVDGGWLQPQSAAAGPLLQQHGAPLPAEQQTPGQQPPPPLCTGLLLQLPDRDLEASFWASPQAVKAYAMWDCYAGVHTIVTNVILGAALLPAFTDRAALRVTWHIAFVLASNVASGAAILLVSRRWPLWFARHRHSFVLTLRLLRLCNMLLRAQQSSSSLRATLAAALSNDRGAAGSSITSSPSSQHDIITVIAASRHHRHHLMTSSPSSPSSSPASAGAAAAAAAAGAVVSSDLRSALLTLSRPLLVEPLATAAQGDWLVRFQWWLPLQVVTLLVAMLGSSRHQHCQMAANPASGHLLQPACHATTHIHHTLLGSLVGRLLLAGGGGGGSSGGACGVDPPSAARALLLYTYTAYGLLIPACGFAGIEFTLKASWARRVLGRQLLYGPTAATAFSHPPASASFSSSPALWWWWPARATRHHQAASSSQQPGPGSSSTGSSRSGVGSGARGAQMPPGQVPPRPAAQQQHQHHHHQQQQQQRFPGVMSVFSTCAVTLALLTCLWHACVWLAPRLPAEPCSPEPCAELGTCRPLAPCDGRLLCRHPGLSAAVLLYALMVFIMGGQLAITRIFACIH